MRVHPQIVQDAHYTPIVPYTPMPGVVPAAQMSAAMAMDTTPYDFINAQALWTGQAFPGFPYLALLSQKPEYRKISGVFAQEMTRKWIALSAKGEEDKTDLIGKIDDALDRYHVQSLVRKCVELDGLFGRAQMYVDVKMPRGANARDDADELLTPLFVDPAKIKRNSLLGFRVVEPMWTYPGAFNAADPLAPDFYRPSEWYVMGKTIHASRLILFRSREVPDMLKPAYNFSGLSLSQLAEPYVNNWLRTRDSVSDLVHSFSVSGIKTNMSDILAGGAQTDIFNRAQLFNQIRDNRGVFMLDKEAEEFFQFNTPLGGLSELQSQSQEHMASVSSIPLVKLLGIQPSGLNASSDGEIRVFYDDVHAKQEMLLRDNLKTILDLIQLSEFGQIDPDVTFDFVPLYELNEEQRANVRKADADTDVALVGAGVLSPDDSRRRLAADPESLYHGLEVNDDLGDGPDPDDDLGLEERKNTLQAKVKSLTEVG